MPAAIAAFEAGWPEADLVNIVDDSLFHNLSSGKADREAAVARFQALTEYALGPTTDGRRPQALLFCCSAFAYAIELARAGRQVPILTPAEAGLEQALQTGRRIGLVVSTDPVMPPLAEELANIARAMGRDYELVPIVAEGAIAALRAGDGEAHDRLVIEAIAAAPATDVVLMGQFTMSRAASVVPRDRMPPVLTTPGAAVHKLRALLQH
ncbi:aspartate/glutamate racemase family protein [Variovorax sp. dw_308]|nr:aspartate/glutamate racemase family protein [Variovorax sp. dw_308]